MSNFDFSSDLILENDRVQLRPLKKEDFVLLTKFSLREPELWKYSLIPANGLENLKKYIQLALEGRKAETSYPFIVYDKKFKKYAGCTRFYDYQQHHDTVQLGYTWYGKDFQSTGLNKNCKFLMLQFAFEEIGLERVEFRADAKNEHSIAAMKSIGCKEEGVLRLKSTSPTGRRYSIVLSILKEEWLKEVKEKLQNRIKS